MYCVPTTAVFLTDEHAEAVKFSTKRLSSQQYLLTVLTSALLCRRRRRRRHIFYRTSPVSQRAVYQCIDWRLIGWSITLLTVAAAGSRQKSPQSLTTTPSGGQRTPEIHRFCLCKHLSSSLASSSSQTGGAGGRTGRQRHRSIDQLPSDYRAICRSLLAAFNEISSFGRQAAPRERSSLS